MTRTERHNFVESHRAEILKDVETLGRIGTMQKWQIPASSLPSYFVRWRVHTRTYRPVPSPASNGHQLPELPAWKDSWEPDVQRTWLETYQILLAKT